MKDYDREFAQQVGKRLGQMSQQEAESWMPKPPQEDQTTVSLPPLALDAESVATYQKRHDVAEAFFAQYIDLGEGVTAEQVIGALVDLLSCEGDLDQIVQSMALEMP